MGYSPYPGIDPFALIKCLERGERLERPVNTACSVGLNNMVSGQNTYCVNNYDMMNVCWKELPDKHPTFSELVTTISTILETIAGYLGLTAALLTPAGFFDGGYDALIVTVTDVDGDSREQNLD